MKKKFCLLLLSLLSISAHATGSMKDKWFVNDKSIWIASSNSNGFINFSYQGMLIVIQTKENQYNCSNGKMINNTFKFSNAKPNKYLDTFTVNGKKVLFNISCISSTQIAIDAKTEKAKKYIIGQLINEKKLIIDDQVFSAIGFVAAANKIFDFI